MTEFKLDEEPVQLITLVRNEAEKLRTLLDSSEQRLLKAQRVDPDERHLCIYGLATGDCRSPRALELLDKCAVPYSRLVVKYRPVPANRDFKSAILNVFSAIEVYISHCGREGINNLQAYLCGDVDELWLENINIPT